MFPLIAYAADIIFHPVILINFDAIEWWKHDFRDVRMHQEQHDYHCWYQVASELLSCIVLDLPYDRPEDYTHYQKQDWLETIHDQLLEEYWNAIVFTVGSHQETIEWKDLACCWSYSLLLLLKFLNLTGPLVINIWYSSQDLYVIS